MPEVTVRDAHRGDAPAIAEIWSTAVPYLVRTEARASADMAEDATLRRRRFVGLDGTVVAGTATARQVSELETFVTVEVHPERGSRGIGTALLAAAQSAFPGVETMRSVCGGDPIALAFAVRNGFLPEGEERIAFAEPASAPDAGPAPDGLRAVTLEALPDLRMLLETHNLASVDDPSLGARRFTMYQLRSQWWDNPDNAPTLSIGLVDDAAARPVLAAYTSVQVDRERGRAWSARTATHPAYRRRGLARWVTVRTLNALAEAGIDEAWAGSDLDHPAIIAVTEQAGFTTAARSVRLIRRAPL